ncbi:MAG: hypothetical protein PHE55_21750 [Methylococcaceae bacterium]|nr:hypothetical protein [Methylococcaceae bacterium]
MRAKVLVWLLLIVPAISGAADLCGYTFTNQLVWNKQFRKALTEFFGAEKADLFLPNSSISKQVVEGLGGPPNPLVKRNKLMFASACRAHSCDEKAAVVIQCPARLTAIGLLHYHCTKAGCDSTSTATLFLSDTDSDDRGKTELQTWARQVNAQAVEYRTQSNPAVHADSAPAALRR